MRTRLYLSLLLMCVLLFSCEKDVLIPQYNGFADGYIQMRVNTQWLYGIDSVYEETDFPDVVKHCFEKHTVIDSTLFTSSLNYVIQVQRSNDSSGDFQDAYKYNLVFSDQSVTYSSPNKSYVMLSSPLSAGNSWKNGHTNCYYNHSEITSFDSTYVLNGKTYANVCKVQHCFFYVYDRNHGHRAIYAKNVGLLHEVSYSGSFNRLARCRKTNSTYRYLLSYAY